jgi:hypothetical protein
MRINGYLTPDTQPADLACMKVYYPAHALYQAALLGSIGYLATWKAWEPDEEKTGKVAAELWKEALEKTVEELAEGCGQSATCDLCDMTRDELEQIIMESFENMTINNIFNACGCCGGSSTGQVDQLPDDLPITTNPPDVPGTIPDVSSEYVNEDQCAKAHYILLSWRNAVLEIESGNYDANRYQTWVDTVYENLGGAWDWLVSHATVVLETIGILSSIPGSDLVSEIDSRYIDMKCAILEGGSQSSVYAELCTIVDEMAINYNLRYQMKKMLSYMPLTAPFSSDFPAVPSQYYVAGCPACVDSLVAQDPQDFTCIPDVLVPFIFDDLVTSKVQESCPNVAINHFYDPVTGFFDIIMQGSTSPCTQAQFNIEFITDETNVRMWDIRELTIYNEADNFSFSGQTESQTLPVVSRTDFNWDTCLEAAPIVFESGVRAVDNNNFNVTIIPSSADEWRVTGYMIGYKVV